MIVFFSKAGRTKSVADAIAAGLRENGAEVDFAQLELLEKKKTKNKNAQEKKRNDDVELKPVQLDVSDCDAVFFGSPVFGLMPKRKISKAMETYIRQCSGIEGKKAIVFLTCFGVPGTALKKISGMLQARNASVTDSLTVAYLLGISKKQLEQAREFGKRIAAIV